MGALRNIFYMALFTLLVTPALPVSRISPARMQIVPSSGNGKRLLVIGGNGFVGSEVCRNAVRVGYKVTSLSRRGTNPDPTDEYLCQVDWNAGNALDQSTVDQFVSRSDAAVHAIGLLFDVNSGLAFANNIVSGSKSQSGSWFFIRQPYDFVLVLPDKGPRCI